MAAKIIDDLPEATHNAAQPSDEQFGSQPPWNDKRLHPAYAIELHSKYNSPALAEYR